MPSIMKLKAGFESQTKQTSERTSEICPQANKQNEFCVASTSNQE